MTVNMKKLKLLLSPDVVQTLFLGAAGEVSFDDLTAGVISSTDSTSVLLLV